MGIACYACMHGYFAEVVRASVAASGAVKVEKVWVAADIGNTVINPTGAMNQVQGGLARMKPNGSILDSVMQEVGGLAKTLGPGDRTKLTEYLDSVREIEQRIQSVEKQGMHSIELPDRPTDYGRLRGAHQADVRSADAGVSGGHYARIHDDRVPRAECAHVSRKSACRTSIIRRRITATIRR